MKKVVGSNIYTIEYNYKLKKAVCLSKKLPLVWVIDVISFSF